MPTICCTIMFYCTNCKDKHKLVAPQSIISEVIKSVIGIENYMIATN